MLHQYSLTQRVAVLLISIAAVGVWLFGSQLPQLVSSLPQQLLPIQTNSYNYNYNTCNDSDSDGKELCEKVEQHNHGYKESTSMGNQDSKFEGDWEFIGRSNGVNTYTRKVVGTKLLAFRGEAVLDIHVGVALTPFANLTSALDWVGMLKSVQRFPLNDNSYSKDTNPVFKYDPNDPLEQDIIYQELDLPWPISPREILLHRSFHFNEQQRSISINYKSVEDDRIPITPGAIRTFTPFTSWKFKAICNEELAGYNVPSGTHDSVDSSNSDVDRNSQEMNKAQKFFATIKRKVRSVFRRKGEASTNTHNSNDNKSNEQRSRCRSTHTHVEIECLVDSKGSVPSWFINYMQRYWPGTTISTFYKMAKKGIIPQHPKVAHW